MGRRKEKGRTTNHQEQGDQKGGKKSDPNSGGNSKMSDGGGGKERKRDRRQAFGGNLTKTNRELGLLPVVLHVRSWSNRKRKITKESERRGWFM